jgi:peptidoglycan/xylan/chitin deacetylase (PgdA/CDA1 family)
MSRRTAPASWRRSVALVAAIALAGCGSPSPQVLPSPSPTPDAAPVIVPSAPSLLGTVVGRSDRLLVYVWRDGDTLANVADRFLGSAWHAWQISEANGDLLRPVHGQPIVVPLLWPNPLGVAADGTAQTVPILCYHRIGNGPSKMDIAPAKLEAQLEWLRNNGRTVVRLSDLAAFIAGKRALPQRSVVITFDDGYESVYRNAFPLLRKWNVPVTLFLYTDFIGSRDGLSWAQLDEMQRSGLVDVQAHSKTHSNLTELDGAVRLDVELRQPRSLIERSLAGAGAKVRHFAYPYGDANEMVLEATRRAGYEIGVTVDPGGNPFYASPLLLKRVMIYGDTDLEQFKARLNWTRGSATAGRP